MINKISTLLIFMTLIGCQQSHIKTHKAKSDVKFKLDDALVSKKKIDDSIDYLLKNEKDTAALNLINKLLALNSQQGFLYFEKGHIFTYSQEL